MLFDTDMIIWVQRGNFAASNCIDSADERYISILSYMELLQKASNKAQHSVIKNYLKEEEFVVLPLTADIGHRALIYIEEYYLSYGISADDAIIAATAIENNLTLISSNAKHYKPIKDLAFKKFIPK
jgi:predicted nucleic acid-binding protein